MTVPVRLRAPASAPAEAARDAGAIAALHAASWRSAYRGIFSDAYLDGPVEADRLALWQGRLGEPGPDQVVVLAEAPQGELLGFVCGFVDEDARWGSYINNLHVAPDRKRSGIGRVLLHRLGQTLATRAPTRPVHLFCLEANGAGRRFYEALGGEVVERNLSLEADGSRCFDLRFVWSSPDALMTATIGSAP